MAQALHDYLSGAAQAEAERAAVAVQKKLRSGASDPSVWRVVKAEPKAGAEVEGEQSGAATPAFAWGSWGVLPGALPAPAATTSSPADGGSGSSSSGGDPWGIAAVTATSSSSSSSSSSSPSSTSGARVSLWPDSSSGATLDPTDPYAPIPTLQQARCETGSSREPWRPPVTPPFSTPFIRASGRPHPGGWLPCCGRAASTPPPHPPHLLLFVPQAGPARCVDCYAAGAWLQASVARSRD